MCDRHSTRLYVLGGPPELVEEEERKTAERETEGMLRCRSVHALIAPQQLRAARWPRNRPSKSSC